MRSATVAPVHEKLPLARSRCSNIEGACWSQIPPLSRAACTAELAYPPSAKARRDSHLFARQQKPPVQPPNTRCQILQRILAAAQQHVIHTFFPLPAQARDFGWRRLHLPADC